MKRKDFLLQRRELAEGKWEALEQKNGGVSGDSILIGLPHVEGCREAWGFVEFGLGDEVT